MPKYQLTLRFQLSSLGSEGACCSHIRLNELCYRASKLSGFIDRDQVAAAFDDFQACVWDPGYDSAPVLVNGVEPIGFASEYQSRNTDLRCLG